jgi:hypothetical protein
MATRRNRRSISNTVRIPESLLSSTETGSPFRRKKLEPQNVKAPSSRVDANEQHDRDLQVPAVDTTPVNQVEVPPWAESYEISSNEMDGWCQIF